MKEMIMNAFQALGFVLDELDDFGYGFEYEGINYIWMPDEEDEAFLYIGIPGVLDKSDVSEIVLYQLIDKANATLKYVKVNTFGDSVWLFYERELYEENENLEHILSRMLVHLDASLQNFRQSVLGVKYDVEEETDFDDEDLQNFINNMDGIDEQDENN